jgi:hypothetical protein
MEFDKIAEENEGSARRERLIQMRKGALQAMKTRATEMKSQVST